MSDSSAHVAVLGQDLQTGDPVILRDAMRPRHVSIIGRTGYGKTTLLEHLVHADLTAGTSAIVIDPHGDLSQRIISLASAQARERITLLEVWPDRPFRLNVLECQDPAQLDHTVDDILTLFHRLFDTGDVQIGHRLHRYFGNALRTLIPNGRTLADVQRLFYDDAFRGEMLRGVRNRKVHEFWISYDQIPVKDRPNQLESTINRLDEFLSAETAHAMISATQTTVPLTNVLNQDGQLLLVRIPVGELGEQQARFYGALFLSLLTDRLFARAELPQSARHRLHLYLDEYGWFATSTTAALLQQARKYNLGATIAFQTMADLPDEKNRQAALQVGTFIVLRLIGQNADELVSEFPVIPSRETIEESIGFRKITSLSPEPVDHLLKNPHSNALANQAATAFLQPLQDVAEGKRRIYGHEDDPFRSFELSREDAHGDIRLIDALLVTVMAQRQDLTDYSVASSAADLFIKLALTSCYSFPPMARGVMKRTPAFKMILATWLQQSAQATHSRVTISRFTTSPWDLLLAAEHQRLTDIANDSLQAKWEDERYKAHYDQRTREWLIGEKLKYAAQIHEAATVLELDAAQFITLCKILAAEPILVPTGQEREEFRGRVHIQTYADARIEFAGILANLKEYTAYYQIGSQHGQVALAEPLEPRELNEEAIKAVRERSQRLYGVPIDPPDEDTPPELLGPPRSGPPRPPGPRIGRRPPRHDN